MLCLKPGVPEPTALPLGSHAGGPSGVSEAQGSKGTPDGWPRPFQLGVAPSPPPLWRWPKPARSGWHLEDPVLKQEAPLGGRGKRDEIGRGGQEEVSRMEPLHLLQQGARAPGSETRSRSNYAHSLTPTPTMKISQKSLLTSH